MRTNAGTDHQSRTSFDTASNATGVYAALNYIALTENGTAPAAGDTTLVGEITGFGLERAQATYAHTNGTNLTVLNKVFTKSGGGAAITVRKGGLLNAATGGTLGYSTLVPDPPTLVDNDSVDVDWEFTF